jgi:triphosphoribosyl-dephospho-CoA synthase
MTFPLSRDDIEAAFVAACHAELNALKPGNVHVHSAGHGMDIHHFERAAAAAAPFIADASLTVGARILGAVKASFAATGLNTNLGIVLLCAPLAAAADAPTGPELLRDRLRLVLRGLDRDDATAAFEAIVVANPGGLGRAESGDVKEPATMTLLEAMALAADRDRIAKAYVSGFEDLFELGLPELYAARRAAANEGMAITALHMTYLAAFPDSHIVRKYGPNIAEGIQQEARNASALWHPTPTADTWNSLLALDRNLKDRGINPGTTADLVVATLFGDLLLRKTATNEPD